jgi:hypothetical protein
MQNDASNHELWKLVPQTAYYLVGIVAAIWARRLQEKPSFGAGEMVIDIL